MAKTFTVSFTVSSASDLGKAVVALAKLGINATVGDASAIGKADEPAKAKVYDATTCESIGITPTFAKRMDELAGKGAIERISKAFAIDYGMASTLSSAYSAAKREGREYMYVVKAKAHAIDDAINAK